MAGILAKIGSEVKALSSIKSMPFSRYGGINNGIGGYLPGYGFDWNSSLPGSKYDDRAAAGVLWENPAAAACFVALTKAFAQARPYLERRKTKDGNDWERVDHLLTEKLNAPNEFYSGEKLFGVSLICAMSQGAAFWRFERDGKGDVSEIWYEPPLGMGNTGVAPNWDEKTFIKDYNYFVDGKKAGTIKREDAVYFRHGLNVSNPRMPWAPLGLGSREIATLNAASSYTASIMRNNGVPVGFVSLDGSSAASPQNFPTPDQARELQNRLEVNHGGPHNAGKLAVTSFPWKFNKAGYSPAEMVIDQIRQWPQETVCALLGTPVIVALLPTGAQPTYQNLDASMRWWWDNTIIPLEDAFADEIETQAFQAFDLDADEYRINWDRSKVPALQEDENAKHTMWREDYKAGVIDRYTFLQKIGEEAPEELKGVLHPSATPGNNQAEPLTPEEIEKEKRLNEAAKSLSESHVWTDAELDALTEEYSFKQWDESLHPRDKDGKFGHGGGELHLPVVKDYKSGEDRKTAPMPNGKHSDWTPEKGGTLLHGTSKAFSKFTSREAYLTDDYDEATDYAHGGHLGGGTGKKPMVRTLSAKPGKTMDANGVLAQAMSEGEDFDDALNEAFKWARDRGARYVVFDHPSNVGKSTEQRAIVSLFPDEDLKFTGGWALNKSAKSIEAIWIDEDKLTP